MSIEKSRRAMLKAGGAFAAFAPFLSACNSAPGEGGAGSAGTPDMGAGGMADGVALAEKIATGEITALQAVNAAIARAEAVNPQINAIVHETFEAARAEAEAGPNGPLAGVPSFTKDLMDRKGEPTQFGSRGFAGYTPAADGPLAAAWRKAGIISLGKSTTPEMGLISSTEPLSSGPTRNPWDLDRTTGGSSGGAAALTAARVVPFAHSSDGGGSIRIPASCCGLFGLKPSRARLFPRSPEDTRGLEISVGHAVTLSVRDSAAIFRATQRLDGAYEDIGVVTEPVQRRLKIAYAPDPVNGGALDPQVRTALDDTAELCRELGHEVVDFSVPFDGAKFTDQFLLLWAGGAAAFAQAASAFSGKPIGPEIVEPWTLGLAQMFQARQSELPDAIAYLTAFEAEYHAMFEEFDILLTPTLARPADPIGYQAPTVEYDTLMGRVVSFAAYTAPMNVSGAASMSVPLAWTEDGLPVGAMFSGKRGDDGLLFELAYELEAARPWINRLPPVSAG